MDFGKKKKVIKKKKARTRSSFIPLGVSSIRLLDFPKTETKGYFKNIDNRPLLVYALLSLTGRWLRWHFYLTILLGYTLDLSVGSWVGNNDDGCKLFQRWRHPLHRTNKQTNKQINNPFVYFFPCGFDCEHSSFIKSPITTTMWTVPTSFNNQKILAHLCHCWWWWEKLLLLLCALGLVWYGLVWFGLVGSLFGSFRCAM